MKRTLVYAGAALLLPIGIAIAVNLPEQKEGLWSIHREIINNPGNKKTESTSTICRNHAYDQYANSLAKSMKGCTVVSESFRGGKYATEMRCEISGSVIESKGTTTFQGDTATHTESQATYTPAMAGVSEMTMVMDQKYEGACPVGTQPGDMTSADGKVTHLWKPQGSTP